MKYPKKLLTLMQHLKKLPGVGTRSAERMAFQLVRWPAEELKGLADLLSCVPESLKSCKECGAFLEEDTCPFCVDERKQQQVLCVVANVEDVYAIESTREYLGLYHVLGNLISPLDGIEFQPHCFDGLKKRIQSLGIREVILAIDSTVEGDATSLYLKREIGFEGLKISRLAFGLPMGSRLEYVDGGTLARAFLGRGKF